MRKIFSLFVTLIAAIALNAATVVNFDFSDASAYGYANPDAGKFTQVPTGATLMKDGVTITVAFESGNGFRFFANTNTGVINLRGYVGAKFTIAAPAGKKLAAISADGTNLTSAYLSGGMTSADWTSTTGVESLVTNVIKSTVQFNSMAITVIDDGEVPPAQENIKVDVAGAIAAGMALDSAKTSTDVYDVTGYVVNAQPFSKDHNNQIWWMSDNAENTAAQEFEAYACTVSKNDTLMQVLNGDKVTLTGKITKYYDKTNKKFIIEIKNGTAVFISMAEGDHSIDGGSTPGGDTTAVSADTITVAQALEIGKALADKAVTDKEYVIKGYSCDIVTPYDTAYKNETFWIADVKGTRTNDKTKAFEVYRGKPNTEKEIGLDALIQIRCKIKNYGGIIENSATVTFEVLEQGIIEVPDTINVAQAMEIGKALASGAVSEKTYAIKGYVSSIQDYYSAEFGNETFWITDTKGDRTSDKTLAFEVYRGKPNTGAEIGLDAYIQITCKIKNFNGTIENDGVNLPFEVLEQGLPVVVDTVSVAEALEIGQALADNAYTDNPYVVIGYVTKAFEPDSGKTQQNFYMADDPDVRGDFYAFKASPDSKVADGDYVQLFGKIQKYVKGDKTTIELSYGSVKHLEAPEVDTLTVAEVQALDLAEGATTVERFVVIGYVAAITADFEEDLQSFNLSDDATATTGEFACLDAIIAEPGANLHDQVKIIGKIQKQGGKFRMVSGKATVLNGQGIENIVLTEKAQKVMMDGVVYIIRDNKIFNLQGTQVR